MSKMEAKKSYLLICREISNQFPNTDFDEILNSDSPIDSNRNDDSNEDEFGSLESPVLDGFFFFLF